MNKKMISFLVVLMLVFNLVPMAHAEGFREATASLLLPTTGQAMNGQIGAGKTKLMGAVEVASITAVTVLGIATGGATVLWGAIPLATNHVWSSMDAYKNAKNKNNAAITMAASDQEMIEAQRTLEQSRYNRFDREQIGRSDLRERLRLASEQANA